MPKAYRDIVDEQIKFSAEKRSITDQNTIPATTSIPLDNQHHWLKIPDVICVYVDMVSSTKLSATLHSKITAGVYQLFTGTAVRLFHAFKAPYIDVRGDGVFALFNSDQPYRAIAAAVSFKTFAQEVFVPKVKDKTELELGAHIGIDQDTVLVRRIGFRRINDRTDRQNEVWAGKPINMAAKLASLTKPKELFASERYYENITDELARKSCGCSEGVYTGRKTALWEEIDFEIHEDYSEHKDMFDFAKAYRLRSLWCPTHGEEYCNAILALDEA